MKIQFSTFKHWPGVVSCLNNIKSIILERYPEAQIRVRNFDGPNISFSTIKELKFDPPDFLFVGGWDNRIKSIVQNTSKSTKTVLMWCSPITQIELGGEMSRFFDVWNCLETGILSYLGIPLETDCESLKLLNKKIVYLPIYLDTKELDLCRIKKDETNDCITDLFCAPCPRKNLLSQIVALSHHDIKLHLNYQQSLGNSSYFEAVNRLIKKSQNFDWLNREDYLKKIQVSDFGMQVSLSESFDYVAAEHMYYGIPTVLSKVIPYSSYDEISPLVVSDHQNVYEISKIVKKLVENKNFREEMGEKSKEVIKNHIENNKNILLDSVQKILEGKV
jgi:hypothetical protein